MNKFTGHLVSNGPKYNTVIDLSFSRHEAKDYVVLYNGKPAQKLNSQSLGDMITLAKNYRMPLPPSNLFTQINKFCGSDFEIRCYFVTTEVIRGYGLST